MDNTGVKHVEVCKQCTCQHYVNIKQSDLFCFVCAIISIVACIVAVSCSLNCNSLKTSKGERCINLEHILYEIQTLKREPLDRRGFDREGDSDKQLGEINTYPASSEAVTDNDLISDKLLQIIGTNNNYDDEKVHFRRRRAVADLKTCRRKCKGAEKRKCKKDCKKRYGKGKPPVITIPTQVNLPAAHFEAKNDIETQNLVYKQYTKDKPYDEGPLKIFKQADWVRTSSPATLNRDSVAVVQSSGIFLVYAQAFIGGVGSEKSISVIHKKGTKEMNDKLSCYNGKYTESFSEQTCSVFGLMKLDQGDTVEVQRSLATKDIELDMDKTFFGIVQLSGIVLK